MSLLDRKLLLGTVLSLTASFGAIHPALALSIAKQPNQQLIGQSIMSQRSETVPFADIKIHGRVVGISGEQVQIRRDDGERVTYTIPDFDQRRFELAKGSHVILTVRATDNAVVAVRNVSQNSTFGNSDRIPFADVEIHGRIVSIDGDQVQIRRDDGKRVTYAIPEFDQQRFALVNGSNVTLTVRAADNAVVAINAVRTN